eukprot:CAMPEP_0198135748 /NCGR_PEP_ID=MMETSP1442-20131203/60750_1 /TAXON_ID= /ORGANISM="Craspedostauros australis, Strain CCMP3328" /LENGTH=108 /DNA_ID=CAMNT_0043796933 /DNA_START=722 /DNA_END=1048 /DNA_ORIENTATION=-
MEHRDDDASNTNKDESVPLSYMSTRETENEEFPMKPALVEKYQKKDKSLQRTIKISPDEKYQTKRGRRSPTCTLQGQDIRANRIARKNNRSVPPLPCTPRANPDGGNH